ncbi:hybrid sensor histidine kinase/response regulator [Labilibacter sediminis]|nr:hybrid sensor histidine kinase/response regulator [Labilibacter sediminis]
MKYKVLVVDDNPKNLQVVAALLTENDYQVEVALSGRTALSWLDNLKFDAILLDVMMPEMTGFETCEKIKKNPQTKDIPIIFLTARHDVESIAEGFERGGIDYITKPFNHRELLVRLSTQIELKCSREKLVDLNQWLKSEVDKKTHQLVAANNELSVANEELKKLDNAKNDFLKSISHEIRTPLNGIVGSMNLLKSFSQDSYTKEVLSLLDSSVTNLEKYSYAALQISNLHLKGEAHLDIKTIDLVPIVRNILDNINPCRKSEDIDFNFSCNSDEAIVNGDLELIQNAISSLIECSLIYTKKGVIDVVVNDLESNTHIRIQDTGNLFAGGELSHFFDSINNQNYQFERNNAMELYLAKMIVQLHKGSIEFKNLLDKSGTITSITIPKQMIYVEED